MSRPWICFFSQSGQEIVNLAKILGRWPDLIVTNERPESVRNIHPDIKDSNTIVTVPPTPTQDDYQKVLEYYKNPVVTLHQWTEVVPPKICSSFTIFNVHRGLTTVYPELQVKDPLTTALSNKHRVLGCVLQKVAKQVGTGKVLAEERFNAWYITHKEIEIALQNRALYMWTNFLQKTL